MSLSYGQTSNDFAKPPNDRAYQKVDYATIRPLPYPGIREADVFWEKRIWREIDFREKINLPFANPKHSFIEILLESVMQGELKAYSPLEDDFSIPMSVEAVRDKLWTTDSIYVIDEDDYTETLQVVESPPDLSSWKKIRIKEDWIFDEQSSSLIVRIIGIAPIRSVIDPTTGIYLGEEPVFWIYYPEARNILVHFEAFNPGNDGLQMSWDDIFQMRYFSSVIVKESNVYDRSIENYLTGVDAVLESEKIKGDIFDFEQYIWSVP